LKEDADSRSTEVIDSLDDEILRQMSGGKRYPLEITPRVPSKSRVIGKILSDMKIFLLRALIR